MKEAEDLIIKKQYDKAILILNKALMHDPGNMELNIQKGIVYELKQRPDSAWMTYYRMTVIKPKESAGHYYKGLNEYAKRDYINAQKSFTNALKAKGYSGNLESIGAEFIIDINNEWGIDGEFDIPASKVFFERGLSNYQIDSISNAHSDFTNVIQLQYNLGPAYYMRGLCFLVYNYPDKACSDFRMGVIHGDSLSKIALKQYCK